mmetsp:Transcript_25510/g.55504  ORF Transcript_25510/g.55504 Transcript_25510/m.55504 type:complete len:429 (+) Transcript_25510:261-1547(+)|eukprot:CAMPEP_0202898594 /NCGR_PEP_ID=MMETSP1392-20130828/7080_1 /ASSEMBLY_ACC=CAM_ASM_000868 /TAXON_ID=225041 /ORGANISM="Chlamydomonas chlamydogama, Strain SAG 11-48b" /LENGTH=428 /DNA_ID=CAMNT_0049584573 /DNA_START=256 /DNA_END=1542 /DNA_ORIENTATION=+
MSSTKVCIFTWGTGRSGELGHNHQGKDLCCPLPAPVKLPIPNLTITAVSCGEGYSAAISTCGKLLTWGMGYKLGHGSEENVTTPNVVSALLQARVTGASCGEYHMGCWTEEGAVYLWGKSECGCVGDGDPTTHKVLTPTPLSYLSHIPARQLDCGFRTSAVLSRDGGTLYSWGSGANGCLGHGNTQDCTSPKAVQALQDAGVHVVSVSMGSCHAAAVGAAGELFTWGCGMWGNLGSSACPRCQPVPAPVEGLPAALDVSCTKGMVNPTEGPGQSGPHTLVVSADGGLYCMGAGHKGKLGNLHNKWGFHLQGREDVKMPYRVGGPACDDPSSCPSTCYLSGCKVVGGAASALHSAVLTGDGRVWTFGCGSDGRMGLAAYLSGSGGSKQRMKFYVSAPTAVEALVEGGWGALGVAASRRHMVVVCQQKSS